MQRWFYCIFWWQIDNFCNKIWLLRVMDHNVFTENYPSLHISSSVPPFYLEKSKVASCNLWWRHLPLGLFLLPLPPRVASVAHTTRSLEKRGLITTIMQTKEYSNSGYNIFNRGTQKKRMLKGIRHTPGLHYLKSPFLRPKLVMTIYLLLLSLVPSF